MSKHVAGLQKKAAVHAFEDKAGALMAPLLKEDSDDESSQYSSSTTSSISVQVKQTPTEMLKTTAISIGLLGGAVVSTAAIAVAPVVAVIIMAGVCMVNVPYSAYKEFRIVKLPALRNLNNALREDANKLEDEVDQLSEQIELLQPEADRASIVEEELREIASEQKFNVDKLVGLVKENQEILHLMHDNVRERIVQDIFKIVMSSDKNNDGRFCKVETKMLVLKISLQLQEYGVEFDEAKFYKVMASDPSVAQTLSIVKRLIPTINEDGEESDHSGEEDEDDNSLGDDAYDMFRMTTDSSLASSGGGRRPSQGQGMSLSIMPGRTSRNTRTGELPLAFQAAVRFSNSTTAGSMGSCQTGEPGSTVAASPSPVTRVRKRDKFKELMKKAPLDGNMCLL